MEYDLSKGMKMKRLLRENGLSLVLLSLFVLLLGAHTAAGFYHANEEQKEHEQPELTLGAYLQSGRYLESVAENWESEFLQMFMYVVLSALLFQKGSSESKKLDEAEEVDREPDPRRPGAPCPVRWGGFVGFLYGYSLSAAFFLLFFASIVMHAVGGSAAVNEENAAHGLPPESLWSYLSSSQFWFESFQNWQSEFLAIASMVILSIFLRHRGSPESKPVDASHSETGR